MKRMALLWAATALGVTGLSGCTKQPDNPEQIRERSAQTTETLKKNAADATAAIKRDSKAIAQGVREGWTRDHPLNLNTATKGQLSTLPGITDVMAGRIIEGRPYDSPPELVTKGVITRKQYDAIAERVNAK